jgi:nonribosomal peptide synthetase DhbF
VHCLVRAPGAEAARDRLRGAMEQYGLWEQSFEDRVVPVPGDLAAPLLGLSAEQFDQLAAQIGTIIHAGARVNHLETYGQLRNANVRGTQEIFRLAARLRVKPVHYISTSGTVVAGPDDPDPLPDEWVSPAGLLGSDGYTRSKWVAEGIARIASARGIPVAIYRPTRISGHTTTGAVGPQDSLWHYIKACVELGARPERDETQPELENLVPVDYVAQVIVQVALTRPADGTTYNVAAPEPVDVDFLLDYAAGLGYRMDCVSADTWSERLRLAAVAPAPVQSSLLSAAMLNDAEDDSAAAESPSTFRCENLTCALAGTGITPPDITAELLDRYYAYFRTVGFLPEPVAG